MRKLYCVDIDGTLLNHDGIIDPQVFEYFEQHKDNIIIASGRPVHEIRGFGFNCDCVGSNGAEIIKNGKLIERKTLPNQSIVELYNYFVDNFNNVTVSTEKGRYLNSCIDIDDIVRRMVTVFNGSFDQVIFDRITAEYNRTTIGKITDIEQFLQQDDHDVSKLECTSMGETDHLLDVYGNRDDISVFTSIGGHIEVVPAGVNKAQAILQYIGDEECQIFAFGDGNNDIEMFELADVSYAMGNGTDQLKAVATHITDSIDNNGFIKAFDHMLENYK